MEDLREEYLDLGLIPVKEETDPVYERYRLRTHVFRLCIWNYVSYNYRIVVYYAVLLLIRIDPEILRPTIFLFI